MSDGFLLVGYNATTGIERWWRRNPDGTETFKVTQEVDDLLDLNAEEAASGLAPKWRHQRKVASIPLGLLNKWWGEEGLKITDPNATKDIMKRINCSDYRKLRVR